MNKLILLERSLQNLKSVLVAYSGGVDSSLLLAVSHRVLGSNVLAVTAVSEIMTEKEITGARTFAQKLGARHLLVPAGDLENPEFIKNSPERCYYCKKHRFLLLKELAIRHNLQWVVEGSNFDDISDYRPGMQAVRELGIKSPLQEAGLTKKEIRTLAKEIGLPSWDKPAQPCLATRIPYGLPITREALERINKAEAFLTSLLGHEQARVRDHGSIARLELPPEDFSLIIKPSVASSIYREMKTLGYTYIALDLLGYRQGSMNENL